jgi:hypothetical protein
VKHGSGSPTRLRMYNHLLCQPLRGERP